MNQRGLLGRRESRVVSDRHVYFYPKRPRRGARDQAADRARPWRPASFRRRSRCSPLPRFGGPRLTDHREIEDPRARLEEDLVGASRVSVAKNSKKNARPLVVRLGLARRIRRSHPLNDSRRAHAPRPPTRRCPAPAHAKMPTLTAAPRTCPYATPAAAPSLNPTLNPRWTVAFLPSSMPSRYPSLQNCGERWKGTASVSIGVGSHGGGASSFASRFGGLAGARRGLARRSPAHLLASASRLALEVFVATRSGSPHRSRPPTSPRPWLCSAFFADHPTAVRQRQERASGYGPE